MLVQIGLEFYDATVELVLRQGDKEKRLPTTLNPRFILAASRMDGQLIQKGD